MAAHGARRLSRMADNLDAILGIEALCAAQGIEFRAPLVTSPPLQRALACLRQDVPALAEDRFLAPDLAAGTRLIAAGALTAAAALPPLPLG
jgi:histidine ammonia-lyase